MSVSRAQRARTPVLVSEKNSTHHVPPPWTDVKQPAATRVNDVQNAIMHNQTMMQKSKNQKMMLLVGAAHVPPAVVKRIANKADLIVGVDGGSNTLFYQNIKPHVILGDGDSIDANVRKKFAQQGVIEAFESEQETTDLEKALRYADTHAPKHNIVGLGFFGSRFDHTLAALHALRKFSHRHVTLRMGKDAVRLLQDKTTHFNLPVGTRASFFPLEDTTGVSSSGLEYPWQNHTFGIGKGLGVSNRTTQPNGHVTTSTPNSMLMITPWKSLQV